MDNINHDILVFLHDSVANSSMLAPIAVFFAQWFPYLVVLSAIAFVVWKHSENNILGALLRLLLPAFVAVFAVEIVKHLIPSPRPFADLSFLPLVTGEDPFGSFPSAHATFFGALSGVLFVAYGRVGEWALFTAFLIGFARIAVGVHWPVDILAGLLFGFLVGFFAEKWVNLWIRKIDSPG